LHQSLRRISAVNMKHLNGRLALRSLVVEGVPSLVACSALYAEHLSRDSSVTGASQL
jgi:hypothetical protein